MAINGERSTLKQIRGRMDLKVTMASRFFTLDELGLKQQATGQGVSGIDTLEEKSVLEINDLATLDELRSVWEVLHRQTPQPAFCQTLDWLHLYLKHSGTRPTLRAFCVDEQGETTGLTVLVERWFDRRCELSMPVIGNETFLPIGANPWGNWVPVGEHLHSEMTRRHVIDLRGLADPEGMTTFSLHAAGWDVQPHPWSGSAVISFSGSWEKYWSQLSPKLRDFIERGEQQLAYVGPTSFVRIRPQRLESSAPLYRQEHYDQCLRIALNDERQLSQSNSVLNDPNRHQFLRDLFPVAWHQEAADLCFLMVGSQPIAFRFHTMAFGHLQTVWTAVDTEYHDLPLATLLLIRAIKDSFQRRDCDLNLGPMTADVARDWNGQFIPLSRFVIGNGGPILAAQPPEHGSRDRT